MQNSVPRIAFFSDSFHEVNGVALTSRHFEQYASRLRLPMFSCHAGPETKIWSDGSITRCEWKRSALAVQLEADLFFDVLFGRHRRSVREALKQFRPDLIHVTSSGDCGLLGLSLAYDLNIPIAASWHTNVHEFGARRLQGLLRKRAGDFVATHVSAAAERLMLEFTLLYYRSAKLLFAPNPELVNLLSTRLRKPCHLMSRGIDTEAFSPAHRRRTDARFRIGFVGRLSREKNVEAFGAIERGLNSRGLRDFEIVLVGHGSLRELLESNLQQARFTGVLRGEALAQEYAGFDVFAFPSRTDTFGNVVLEAMASGVPAIVTDEGGPQFLVGDGTTGFIARDDSDFVRQIAVLMENFELRRRMASAAREYTVQSHSWDRVFTDVYHAYSCFLSRCSVTGTLPGVGAEPRPIAS